MINRNRSLYPVIISMLLLSAVAARLFFLQVWHHEEISKRVDRIVMRERPQMPCRGMIFDNHGKVLAMSVKSYSIFADANMISDPQFVENELKKVNVNIPRNLLCGGNRSSYIPLASGLDTNTVDRVKALKLPGIGFESGFKRQYPEGKMACHLLGVVGKDLNGLEGVEFFANSYLTGEKVNNLNYRDGRGREISERLLDSHDLRGADVTLTIDRNIQHIAEQEVERAWQESKAKKAIIIVQDPQNGKILAMACRPAFDPGDFSGSWNAMRNPAVSDVFEPGSTFKAVTAAAALQEKLVKRSEVIWCEDGKYKIYDHTINDHEKRGLLTFDQILAYSSNIGFAKISQRIGKDKMYQYIRQFGFNTTTGIDLPGEARGLLREPSKWSGLSLPTISFGQEIGVTAIQMINAYSAIFNGGNLMEPTVIETIKSPRGEILYGPEKRVVRRVVSEDAAAQLRQMMIGVVENGTGAMAKVPFYSVGGKTGTAQKRDPATKRYSSSNYVASFCGAIPAASDPRLVILVVLDEPKGDYWASSRAAPVFSRVAFRSVSCLGIDPDLKTYYLAKK